MKTNSHQDILPPQLENFDRLPDSAYVDKKTLQGIFSCSRTTVWRRVASELLPKPRKFGRNTRWNVGEIRQILANK